ncbi:hypothetical protein UA08_03197 [Talaromyces atroroseus]|uniref:Stc1 domain-containing protein n=1 Tax=Talaromyces atroroseus TaxID=1441469 RepID=A0A225AIK7_TALAT|nr:hypothetical protein UA08_03197 [Talaromyces atroroseus]OKL61271.1 hypothetical protein UA08_03197 [Talaromyces atroroseus]
MPGGWSPETVERAKKARLPERIKCSGCRVPLPQSAFSESQLTRLRSKIAMQGQIAISRHLIRCKSCTGAGVPTDITCARCRIAKPLDAYTKAQRRDTDRATCKNCVSELMTSETWKDVEENENLAQAADVTDAASSVMESTVGGVPLPSSTDTARMPSSVSRRSLNTCAEDYESIAGGVWLEDDEPAVVPIPVESHAPSQSVNFSGWNVSSSTFTEVRRERRVSPSESVSTRGSKGWAKVKSHDPHRNARIMRISDPTTKPVNEESNDSSRTISGTTLKKKVREEMGEASQQFS